MSAGLADAAFDNPKAWTIQTYIDMLSAVQQISHRTFTSEWTLATDGQARIYLRHDIDFSLECAVEMAVAEHRAGVRATYFVEVECPFYNLLSATAAQQIRRIAAMGHPVGLHLVLPPRGEDANDALDAQLRTLRSVLDAALTSIVSLHQPTRHDEVAGRLHTSTTYDPLFFNPATYLSDSAGQWGGSPARWLTRLADHDRPAQLLVHPLWWTQPGGTPRKKLERLPDLIRNAAELELANFRAWTEADQS
jgi:hypothetical protein